jgi:multidrug efflux pump subunit AcrB
LKFNGEAAEVADLGDIQVGVVRGQRVYLRDVATFGFGTERKKSGATYDGEPCVVLKVTKKKARPTGRRGGARSESVR